jgi:hypothetical protein
MKRKMKNERNEKKKNEAGKNFAVLSLPGFLLGILLPVTCHKVSEISFDQREKPTNKQKQNLKKNPRSKKVLSSLFFVFSFCFFLCV